MNQGHGYSERIGARLREQRQRVGMTLVQAAEAAGLHPDSLSRLETGRRSVGVDDLVSLAVAYQVSPGVLLEDAVPEAVPAADAAQRDWASGWGAEFVGKLLEALPEVRADGFVPAEHLIRDLQLSAVKSLKPIEVRIVG